MLLTVLRRGDALCPGRAPASVRESARRCRERMAEYSMRSRVLAPRPRAQPPRNVPARQPRRLDRQLTLANAAVLSLGDKGEDPRGRLRSAAVAGIRGL